MTELIAFMLPYKVLFSHLLLAFLIAVVLSRKTWGKEVFEFVGKNILAIGFLISIGAVFGSLFYSEILGFEPCVLCWWQRAFLYPLPVLFGVALKRNDRRVFDYIVPLAILAGVIALYQSYANLGGVSLLPCTAYEGSCAKVFVKEFGYITIPAMSLTISVYILLLAWINKLYKNANSNTR